MDIQEKEAFKAWFKKEYLGIDNLANQGDEGAITRRDYAYVGWQAAKAQAVPAEFEIGQLKDRITELLDERQDLYAQINDQAVPEGFVLVSAEQMSQWGHMANYAEQYGCPECFEARGYAHSLACEINAYFNVSEAQEPDND